MSDRWAAWGPAALWAGVLFFLSSIPGMDHPPVLFSGEDKVAHLLLYAVLGGTLAWGSGRAPRPVPPWRLLLLGMAWAASDEAHQALVPGRDPSLGDLAADTAGLLLGYMILTQHLTRRAAQAAGSSS